MSRGAVMGMAMAVYLGGVAVIATMAARRTRTPRDFFAGGTGLGVVTMGVAAMAATISGFAFIGGPGLIYRTGFGGVHIILSLGITNTLTAWVLGRQLRRMAGTHGTYTIPGAIRVRYASARAQGLAALAILVAVVGYLATNLLALGLVLQSVLGVPLLPAIWLGMLVTLAYSASGGILAGAWADLFQGAVMAAASVMVWVRAMDVGGGLAGITATIAPVDPAFLSPWGHLSPLAALSLYFVFGIGALGQPHVVHKFFMLRDPRQLRWYPTVMTVAMVMSLLLFVGVGLVVKALVVRGDLPPLARPDDATPTFLQHHVPPLLAGLVFAGVAAAIMSSVNAFLNVGAAAVAHDLPAALGRPRTRELLVGRWATVGLALAGALLASGPGVMVAFLGIFGWGLFASTLVPSLAIGLNWPRATASGAAWSIGTGLAVTLGLESLAWARVFTFPAGVTATALALVAALAVFLGVSVATPARDAETGAMGKR